MVQITKCKCGSVIAACKEPFCYENAEYQRDTRAYIKKGYTVSMVESNDFQFEKCKCASQTENLKQQTKLFK